MRKWQIVKINLPTTILLLYQDHFEMIILPNCNSFKVVVYLKLFLNDILYNCLKESTFAMINSKK